MTAPKNPVEKRIDDLAALWLQACEAPEVRVIVWRVPGNAGRMMAAFFEAQKHLEPASTPDLFQNFDAPFETGFGYSRELMGALRDGYVASRGDLKQQGLPIDWRGAHGDYADSAAGTLAMFQSFAEYYQGQMRYFAPVLSPGQVASSSGLEQWLDTALRAPIPDRLRLCLVDHTEDKRWQALAERHGKAVRVIDAPIDMFDIARQTAAQSSGGAGPGAAYRAMLADVMTLLEKGSAAQTAARADKAMKLVQREQWHDQQVVLHMAVAGAHLKQAEHSEAIHRYRAARECAIAAEAAKHPAGANLIMQTWFGEAGVWLSAHQPVRASEAYTQAAAVARRVPNAMFALEGLRMAGYCLAQDGQVEPARERYLAAVAEARAMPPADRPLTTLALLLQDMLRLQDAPRAERIAQYAPAYQQEVAEALQQAEAQSARLGPRPAPAALEKIEKELLTRYELAFRKLCDQRERLIAGGDVFFRKVVALARDYLHPAWNGVPEVRHPLDKDLPEWSQPPQFAQLPEPDDLLDTAGTSTAPAPAVPAEAGA